MIVLNVTISRKFLTTPLKSESIMRFLNNPRPGPDADNQSAALGHGNSSVVSNKATQLPCLGFLSVKDHHQ